MATSQPFKLIYAHQVKSHLRTIESKYHTLIRDAVENQLRFGPLVETKNRKPLTRPAEFGADWELRFGPANCFRVFYEANERDREVYIIAIGEKRSSKVLISGGEVEL